MAAHRLRCWSNIEPALSECPVFAAWAVRCALKFSLILTCLCYLSPYLRLFRSSPPPPHPQVTPICAWASIYFYASQLKTNLALSSIHMTLGRVHENSRQRRWPNSKKRAFNGRQWIHASSTGERADHNAVRNSDRKVISLRGRAIPCQ